jgi:hypothetical protein
MFHFCIGNFGEIDILIPSASNSFTSSIWYNKLRIGVPIVLEITSPKYTYRLVNLLERLAKYEQDNEPGADKIVKGYILAGRIRCVFDRCSNLLIGFYLPVEMLLLFK